jgi:hypothetical protein
MGGFSSAPQCRVNFFTEKGNLAASATLVDTKSKDQIISVTTHKDFRSPCGSFTIQLTGETVGGTIFRQIPGTGGEVLAQNAAGVVSGRVEVASETVNAGATGWKDWLRPGDLVVIEMGPDRPQPTDSYYAKNFVQGISGTTEIVMVGTIDDIHSDMAFSEEGKPRRVVTVTGRDFGSYLVDDMVDFNPYFDVEGAYLGFLKNNQVEFPKGQLGGTPANVIDTVLRAWIFAQFDVEFDVSERGTVEKKGTMKLSNILRHVLDNSTPAVEFFQSWVFSEGSPWSIFQQVQSAPWYLLQIDTRRQKDIEAIMGYGPDRIDNAAPVVWNTNLSKFDTQVALMYYRNPHSNRHYDDWTKLPTRVVTADDLVEESIGVSRDEVFNRWVVTPEIVGFNRVVVLGKNALRAKDLERRFGIKPRILKTPFISGSRFEGQGDIVKLVERYTQIARDWDLHNLSMLSGSMTIKGMAQVRIGDRLHYMPPGRRVGIDYYVEGVQQEFIQYQGWKTTLAVTRGQRHRDVGQKLFDKNGKTVESPSAMEQVAL